MAIEDETTTNDGCGLAATMRPKRKALSSRSILPTLPVRTAAFLADFSGISGAASLFDQKVAVEHFARTADHSAPLLLYVHSGFLEGNDCFALARLFDDVRDGMVEAVVVADLACFAPDAETSERACRALQAAGALVFAAGLTSGTKDDRKHPSGGATQ